MNTNWLKTKWRRIAHAVESRHANERARRDFERVLDAAYNVWCVAVLAVCALIAFGVR